MSTDWLDRLRPVDPAHAAVSCLRVVMTLDALWMLGFGAAVVMGGRQRMGGPSLYGLVALADRLDMAAQWWGVPPLVAGVALLVGVVKDRPWPLAAGFILGLLFSLSFVIGGLYAVPRNPQASLTALPTYLFVAALQMALLYVTVLTRVLRRAAAD